MRKKGYLLLTTMCMICISGCTNKKPEANMRMYCTYPQVETDTGSYTSTADFTYVKETDELVTGSMIQNYKDYPKDQYNNKVLTDLVIRKTKFDELKGVTIDVSRGETEFGSKEQWDYRNIDLESAMQIDEEQEKFIDTDADFYSFSKTKRYYESNGYSCSISDLEDNTK